MEKQIDDLDSSKLEAVFKSLGPLLFNHMPQAPRQTYSLDKLEAAFKKLQAPLASAKAQGGLINPWAITGLKRDEVRNAAALAGLWTYEFGGDASRLFLCNYLAIAIPKINWKNELQQGYSVQTELSPLGDQSDRVDLVIETSNILVGIEVKIDAGLGVDQLERYTSSIKRRAVMSNLEPYIIFLAPFTSQSPEVISTSWRDVERATKSEVHCKAVERTFVQHFIACFGAYVLAF